MTIAQRAGRALAAALFSAILLLGFLPRDANSASAAAALRPGPGFSLVELFTSQGCSSCPPADAALAALTREARERDLNVYVLSRHVDYWNRLGWRDPYSSPIHSNAQREHARRLGSRVYTPQAVINGREQVVGSQRGALWSAVQRGLDRPRDVQLALTVTGDHATVALQGAPRDARVSVAVSRPAGNRVPHGENAGRSLSHVHVVHEIHPSQPPGRVELTSPPTPGDEVTAWVVAPSGEVLAAARTAR